MAGQPSASLLSAVAKNRGAKAPASDKLARLQELGVEARGVELEIQSLEEAIEKKGARLLQLCQKEMVDLMVEIGVDRIGVNGDGNMPPKDYRLVPYYSANIAASWPPDKREAGFAFVTKMGAADLIKTEVSVLFPKGGLKAAQKLAKSAKKLKVPFKDKKKGIIKQQVAVDLTKSIPSGSLKAWLKELYESGKHLSQTDLEKIGGSVGRIVRGEERKE